MKAIILARVSTEEQKREGQSIPAQLRRAREYAGKRGLEVKNEYQFDESSTKDKRTKFEQVVNEIKASKDQVALVVECVDRLQRSFKESVLLDDLRKQGRLELHFIRENLVINDKSNSAQLMQWDMMVMFARSYVLQLSDNVKRSIEQKLRNGEWSGPAPIGYHNVVGEDGKKTLIIDENRAPLIRRMFQRHATGNYSINTLRAEITDMGLRSHSKDPKPLTNSMVDRILKNPFYYGEMRVKGQLYSHKYERVIDKSLFDEVQSVIAGKNRSPVKYASKPFIFRGLIKCAECGCAVTPEITKGKYIYYSCTNHKKAHAKRVYVPEKDLLESILEVLDNLKLPDVIVKKVVQSIKELNKTEANFYKLENKRLIAERESLGKRMSNLITLRVDGEIDEEQFALKMKEFKNKQEELLVEINKHDEGNKDYHLTVSSVLTLLQRAGELFRSSELEQKQQMLSYLFQNFELKDKVLQFKLKTPFDTVLSANMSDCYSQWLGGRESHSPLRVLPIGGFLPLMALRCHPHRKGQWRQLSFSPHLFQCSNPYSS